jgi:hypothetical protein
VKRLCAIVSVVLPTTIDARPVRHRDAVVA